MKKLFCCVFAVTSSLCINAQPVLTAATNNPVVGQVDSAFGIYAYTSTPVYLGSSGAGVTWDFSGITPDDHGKTTFIPCADAPYCDSFSGCNLVRANIDSSGILSSYAYQVTNTSECRFLGNLISNSPAMLDYYSSRALKYPLAFGDAYIDTNYYKTSSSSPAIIEGSDSVTVDGYGTLITPVGTYTNVLRIVRRPLAIYGFQSVDYYWYKVGYRSPLMALHPTFNYLGEMNYVDGGYLAGEYLPAGTNVVDINNRSIEMNAYPNPATDVIQIRFELSDAEGSLLTLSDVTGRCIKSFNDLQMGTNQIALSIADIQAGLYTIHLQTASGATIQKISVIR